MRDGRLKRAGNTLGSTILAVAILAALAAGLANLCVTHLRLSVRADNSLHAANLARSALAAGIARVAKSPEFGTPDGPPDSTITVTTEQGTGFLTFSRSEANEAGFPFSTNNISNTTTVEGSNEVSVSAGTVHLVARGSSNGVERQVEAVVRVPSYPWAVAATGRLEIISGATVGALPAGLWPPSPDQLEPADLVANSSDPDAITLGGSSHILGDVETPGGVIRGGQGVVIDGQVREGATPTDIPVMHPETFDPLRRRVVFDALDSSGSSTGTTGENGSPNNVDGGGNGGPDTSNLGPANDPAGDSPPTVAPPDQGPTGSGLPVSGNLLLSGASRSASDLTLDNGLTMDAASLYVDGNLVIRGRLEGFGVLVVKGDITVDAGASLEGANQLAVLSGGKVTLRGVGPSSTVIRGIFYAEDGIEAHQMTVIGALIAGGENASILLDDVAVYTSEAVQGQVAQTSGGPLMKGAKTYEIMQDPFSQAFRQAGPGDGSDQPLADILDPESNPQPGGLPTVSTGGPSSFISVRERMKVVTWIER